MNPSDQDTFDYLIVGAGTAGCVLANRLSADSGVRVGLVEAGPSDDHFTIRIPAAAESAGYSNDAAARSCNPN